MYIRLEVDGQIFFVNHGINSSVLEAKYICKFESVFVLQPHLKAHLKVIYYFVMLWCSEVVDLPVEL